MSKRIIIDPVTRIEGHAKITTQLDEAGHVSDAIFHVVEFRGFERFCEGRPVAEMAGITPRICGICPVSHLLASAKAGDAIMAVDIPPAADKLRRLGWSVGWAKYGCPGSRIYWQADAHKDDGRRFIAQAEELTVAFLELERLIGEHGGDYV